MSRLFASCGQSSGCFSISPSRDVQGCFLQGGLDCLADSGAPSGALSQSRQTEAGQVTGAGTHRNAGSSSPTAGTGGRPRTGRSRSHGVGTPGPRRPSGCPADFRTPGCKARAEGLTGCGHTVSTPFLWSRLPALCARRGSPALSAVTRLTHTDAEILFSHHKNP